MGFLRCWRVTLSDIDSDEEDPRRIEEKKTKKKKKRMKRIGEKVREKFRKWKLPWRKEKKNQALEEVNSTSSTKELDEDFDHLQQQSLRDEAENSEPLLRAAIVQRMSEDDFEADTTKALMNIKAETKAEAVQAFVDTQLDKTKGSAAVETHLVSGADVVRELLGMLLDEVDATAGVQPLEIKTITTTTTMTPDYEAEAEAIQALMNIDLDNTEEESLAEEVKVKAENGTDGTPIYGLVRDFLCDVEKTTGQPFGPELKMVMDSTHMPTTNDDDDDDDDNDLFLYTDWRMTEKIMAALVVKAVLKVFVDDGEDDDGHDRVEAKKDSVEKPLVENQLIETTEDYSTDQLPQMNKTTIDHDQPVEPVDEKKDLKGRPEKTTMRKKKKRGTRGKGRKINYKKHQEQPKATEAEAQSDSRASAEEKGYRESPSCSHSGQDEQKTPQKEDHRSYTTYVGPRSHSRTKKTQLTEQKRDQQSHVDANFAPRTEKNVQKISWRHGEEQRRPNWTHHHPGEQFWDQYCPGEQFCDQNNPGEQICDQYQPPELFWMQHHSGVCFWTQHPPGEQFWDQHYPEKQFYDQHYPGNCFWTYHQSGEWIWNQQHPGEWIWQHHQPGHSFWVHHHVGE